MACPSAAPASSAWSRPRRAVGDGGDRQGRRRLVALGAGGEDLATDLGVEPTPDALYLPKMLAVVAARAAGILPLGFIGTVAGFPTWMATGRCCGGRARSASPARVASTPSQVPIINEEYGARPEDVASPPHGRRLQRSLRRASARSPSRANDRRAGRGTGAAIARTRPVVMAVVSFGASEPPRRQADARRAARVARHAAGRGARLGAAGRTLRLVLRMGATDIGAGDLIHAARELGARRVARRAVRRAGAEPRWCASRSPAAHR